MWVNPPSAVRSPRWRTKLGVTLLIRGPRSVELTEAGRVMQEEGVKLLEYIEQLKKRVQTAGRGTMGTLRVTSIPAYVPVLTELQDKTAEIYPNLSWSSAVPATTRSPISWTLGR